MPGAFGMGSMLASWGDRARSMSADADEERQLRLDRRRVGRSTVNQRNWTGGSNIPVGPADQAEALRPTAFTDLGKDEQSMLQGGYNSAAFEGVMSGMNNLLSRNKETRGLDWYDLPDYTRTQLLAGAGGYD